MKLKKKELILLIATIVFTVAGLVFYYESKNIVTTSLIPYDEQGTANYKVHLSDNTYYNKDYLDEGMQYISSIIDYVDLDFRYIANYQGIKNYKVDKNIVANIKITDLDDNNKVIYTKTETLKEEHADLDKLSINDSIKIDYVKYNDLVNEIKSKYAISAKSTLSVSYNIIYSSEEEGLSTAKKMVVDIPLSEQMINITKENIARNSDVYVGKSTNSPINGIMSLLMILMFIFALASLIFFIMRVKDRISKESKYDRFINKVLREYDSYITETKEDNYITGKSVIEIGSFKELLDVRNNIDKTIVYTKIDDNTSKFQIIDEEVYEYVAKREEMDK
ncbi:MAG: hypothetical protein IJ097_00845 [Bacilli bacterium]|nr:hypothetical protein [Bacilli bacterium]